MKKLSSILLGLLALLWLALTAAKAEPVRITDLRVDPFAITGDHRQTDPFAAFYFLDQTLNVSDATSLGDIGVGTSYVDYGHAVIVGLRDEFNHNIADTAGLGDDWSIWIEWNIQSHITRVEGNIYYLQYDSGTVNAYLATTDWSFGTTQSPSDDTAPSTRVPFLSGTLDAAGSSGYIVYDGNIGRVFRNASVNFNVTYLNSDALSSDSMDLATLVNLGNLFSLATESAASGLSDFESCGGYVCVAASGSGSVHLSAVPEPHTISLLGLGLMGVGVVGARLRRRSV